MNDNTTDDRIWREHLHEFWRAAGTLGMLLLLISLSVGVFLGLGYGMHLVFYPGTGVFIPDWQLRLGMALGIVGLSMFILTIMVEEWTNDTTAPTAEEVDDGLDA